MWQRVKPWVIAGIGLFVGVFFVPAIVIAYQDSRGIPVDPVMGGIYPALIAGPFLAFAGFWLGRFTNEDSEGY